MSSRAESWSPRGDSAAHNLPRIELRALPVEEALALLAGGGRPPRGVGWHPGYPMDETLDALSLLNPAHAAPGSAGGGSVAPATPRWWLWQVLLDGEVVGDVGFHGPPASGGPVEVEIGYNVVDDLRGQGIATSACALILELAWSMGADAVLADTTPDHIASQRVLHRNGFVDQGDHHYRIPRPR